MDAATATGAGAAWSCELSEELGRAMYERCRYSVIRMWNTSPEN